MRISDWSSDVCSSDLTQHIAGTGERRQAVSPRDRELGAPGAIEHELGQIVSDGCHALDERKLFIKIVTQSFRDKTRLLDALLGNFDVKVTRLDFAVVLVLQPRQQFAQEAEARWHGA